MKLYVCSECGAPQDSMDDCTKCGSVRVITVSVAEKNFGPDWKQKCFPRAEYPNAWIDE